MKREVHLGDELSCARQMGRCGWEVVTKDAVCSETGFESLASIDRKCVCVGEEPCRGRVRERPGYEGDAAPFISIRVHAYRGYLLLTD